MANRISDKYKTRVRDLGPMTQSAKISAEYDLKRGVQRAVATQIYLKTPLPVTKDMIRSIESELTEKGVTVGFDSNKNRRGMNYPLIRLKMTGRSKKGGHVLNTDIAGFLKKHVRPGIYARNARMHKRMLRGE